ncbi:hypothetical protein T11_12028 [Trichinella zimbabwensis]|uniref:Uncharacterized protein n=1 Tax=Trichinella zimbabwensis TaxID=268475 RepID=A0A0V1HQ16_9BILA|nr:hypothetical protein T11_12028 [Trichinella zimbabwensis]
MNHLARLFEERLHKNLGHHLRKASAFCSNRQQRSERNYAFLRCVCIFCLSNRLRQVQQCFCNLHLQPTIANTFFIHPFNPKLSLYTVLYNFVLFDFSLKWAD